MTKNEISPFEALEKALRFWWLIAVLGIAGGLLGWLFNLLQPPIYEAGVMYTIGLNEKELLLPGQTALSYVDQENYLSPIEALFYAQDVRDEIIRKTKDINLAFDVKYFYQQEFRIERIAQRWRLIVQNHDPQAAASLADIWADSVFALLTRISDHAILARELDLEITTIQHCFSQNSFSQANTCAGTSYADLAEKNANFESLNIKLASEQEASRGITPEFYFAISERASLPVEPVLFIRSLVIFAGTAIGLVIGFILTATTLLPLSKKHVRFKN